MVKKKTKKLKKRGLQEDVATNTGLPPKVGGQLRCHLLLSVNQIVWLIPNPPDVTHVRVKWWGEEGDGAIFRPLDVKKGNKDTSRTTARYAIRSGPKQFAAYLQDMGSLVLEVLSGLSMVTVARCNVDQIATLTPNRAINGFFPALSADAEKVAELQVRVALESLMMSYESMSSVPTPDMSTEIHSSWTSDTHHNPPRSVPQPIPHPQPAYSSGEDPFASPNPRRFPRGVDNQIYSSGNVRESLQTQPVTTPSVSRPSSSIDSSQKDLRQSEEKSVITKAINCYQPNIGGDLVSELLDRGTKLREAMIVSTMNVAGTQDKAEISAMQPTYVPDFTEHLTSPTRNDGLATKGSLFKEILMVEGKSSSIDMNGLLGVGMSADLSGLDDHAIELILGKDDLSSQQWKVLKQLYGGTGSGGSSISGDDTDSDLADPIHDDSIINELFYKTQNSDDSDLSCTMGDDGSPMKRSASQLSLEEPGNRRPPSRASSVSSITLDEPVRDTDLKKRTKSPNTTPKKKGKKMLKKRRPSQSSDTEKKKKPQKSQARDNDSRRLSDTSRVSFDPAPSDADDTEDVSMALSTSSRQKVVDGLSIERLTLLGRVHVARVVIDILNLYEQAYSAPSTPTKTKSKTKGKPPRPAKKIYTYFVEYQFPVVATSRDKYSPNAMATEVMRVASKKVADGAVTFGHRSVFPVLFDGEAIEKWWKSALVFKVYSKAQGQKVPRLLGVSTVSLKEVLKSESLFLDRQLVVKDRSNGTASSTPRSRSSDHPIVGEIKVSVELGSDARDFSTAIAKTRLAEMMNPKIVPIPPQAPARPPPTSTKSGMQTGVSTENIAVPTVDEDRKPPLQAAVPVAGQRAGGGGGTLPSTQHLLTATGPPPTQNHLLSTANMEHFEETLALHTLLLIPEGQNITLHPTSTQQHGSSVPTQAPLPLSGWTGRDMATRNLYLVCRMFWCQDQVSSTVSWGTFDPQFNFLQVAPVLLSAPLLERLRNNFMIIEVWDKKTSAEADKLVGIVKLPLHQFYMSYRDRKVAQALLRSQYPVVSVDSDMPITNPLSCDTFGQLRVLLAMGSLEQVTNLQRLKCDGTMPVHSPQKPLHYLERQEVYGDGWPDYANPNNLVEHMFEVSVEGVQALQLLDNMIWGEADCFIQYHFPTQTQNKQTLTGAMNIASAVPTLKSFRTATTLCVPDPVFSDISRHRLILPEGTPVQREILTVCAGAGGGAGGVPFEVWCRHYYPNVRDVVIAKCSTIDMICPVFPGVPYKACSGWHRASHCMLFKEHQEKTMLPLAKLCAMVTMQRHGEPNVQTFSLPLTQVGNYGNDLAEHTAKMHERGQLEVTINYKSHTVKSDADPNLLSQGFTTTRAAGQQVCISVGLLRASGLKNSASALARHDRSMEYPSEVGVNSYVRVQLSFLEKQDERITRTVARSFSPEFSYFMDFPCPLLWTNPESDALSLAEILENAEATFELWHQSPSNTLGPGSMMEKPFNYTDPSGVMGRRLVTMSGDILLGTVTVPLRNLLTRKTGIKGWYAVHLPSNAWDPPEEPEAPPTAGQQGLERVVGGLELSVHFSHDEDLERVIHAARGVGWAPVWDTEWHRDDDDMLPTQQRVGVSVEMTVFPLVNALIAGQTKLDPKTSCYVRYKLYDKRAVCSKPVLLEENDHGYLEASLQHSKNLNITGTAPFNWYMHEERLEIQVWVTTHSEEDSRKPRPRHRDKLIGSAYVDLSSLVDTNRRQHVVSGVFPLFKPGAATLGGACLRAFVSMKHNLSRRSDDESEAESDITDVGVRRRPHSRQKNHPPEKNADGDESTEDLGNTWAIHISIECAYHIPKVKDTTSGEMSKPNCYVSYQTAEETEHSYTNICEDSTNPVWTHEHSTRLGKDVFTQDNKHLVFKVWHKPSGSSPAPDKSVDQVLGFVSIDLAPLASGFHQVAGFYNIMDFNGHCQGQIKVSITPQEALHELMLGATIPPQMTSICGANYCSTLPAKWQSGDVPDGTASILARFNEHYQNIRHYHEKMHADVQHIDTEPNNVSSSRSFLLNSLRNNIQELDTITGRLKQRLHGNTVPVSDHDTTSSSHPLSGTTTNLEAPYNADVDLAGSYVPPFSESVTGIPQDTTSTIVSNMGSQSAAHHSSSLSATTTFLGFPLSDHNDNTATSSARSLPSHHEDDHLTMTGSSSPRGLDGTQTLLSTMESHYSTHGQGTSTHDDDEISHPPRTVHFQEDEDVDILRQQMLSQTGTNEFTTVTEMTVSPFASHEKDDEESEAYDEDADKPFQDYMRSLHQQESDFEEDFNDEDLVAPRPLNDISSVDFSNIARGTNFDMTMRDPLAELRPDNTSQGWRYSEDDSWFSASHVNDDSQVMETITYENPADLDDDDHASNTDKQNSNHDNQSSQPSEVPSELEDVVTDSGREALDGLRQKSDENGSNIDDVVAGNHQSDEDPDENVASRDDEDIHLQSEENPNLFRHVSRVPSECSSRESVRRSAEYRREYERHRHGSSSEDERAHTRRRHARHSSSDSDSDQHSYSKYSSRTAKRKLRKSPKKSENSSDGKRTPTSAHNNPPSEEGGNVKHFTNGVLSDDDDDGREQDDDNVRHAFSDAERIEGRERVRQPAISDHQSDAASGHNDSALSEHSATAGSQTAHTPRSHSSREDSHPAHQPAAHTQPSSAAHSSDEQPTSARSNTSSARSNISSARSNTSSTKAPSTSGWPNFFRPPEDMMRSMRTLKINSRPGRLQSDDNDDDDDVHSARAATANQLLSKLSTTGKTSRFSSTLSAGAVPKPSKEQTERIAKIFASRFTS